MANQGSRFPKLNWDHVLGIMSAAIPLMGIGATADVGKLVAEIRRSRGELDDKVSRAVAGIREASLLVNDLEQELTSKLNQVEQLKGKYEHYQQLSTVEEDKARALVQEMQIMLGEGRNRERWIAIAIGLGTNILVFLLGVWLSPWISSLHSNHIR